MNCILRKGRKRHQTRDGSDRGFPLVARSCIQLRWGLRWGSIQWGGIQWGMLLIMTPCHPIRWKWRWW
jgi:hypothetical protein